MKIIAHIRTDFPTKFGVPRQAGVVESLTGRIVFEKEYRNAAALKGLEGFSHIWLIWQFSKAVRETWSPTVRPPRLGGNARMGVFATRSPFRPNPIGLSSVKLLGMEAKEGMGTVLYVSGADLMDGTPIYDIKPYLSFTDSHPDAKDGFAGERYDYALDVDFPEQWLAVIPQDKREALIGSLKQDPRPAYHDDPETPYGFEFAGFDVRFKVRGDVLSVFEVKPLSESEKVK